VTNIIDQKNFLALQKSLHPFIYMEISM